jgi:predicted RNA-binding Zn ribbon-like protein
MIVLEHQADALKLSAGRLCLDFANTADWHASDQPEEGLKSYVDLVVWAEKVGVLTEAEAQHLAAAAASQPDAAAAVLKQAITLREAIYRIFAVVAGGRTAQTADLAILNQTLSATSGRLEIVSTEEEFVWHWAGPEGTLDHLLWPIARSAADLLTSTELSRVGQCADEDGCGWLFLDMSRNRSRRWCDIKDCGNRAKAKRHYARQKYSAESHKN